MLTFCVMCSLESMCLDFTQAFPQADIKRPTYMEIPTGYDNPNGEYVLKLKCNFYGLADANLTWFEHCRKGLQNRGFIPSNIDPCLFYKEGMILLIYVDDCIVFAKSRKLLDDFIASMKRPDPKSNKKYPYPDNGFDFTTEDNVEKFLGVEISKSKDHITIRQPHLIERIIKAIGFEDKDVHSKLTPLTGILHKDEDDEARKDNWNYRSLIGMLNYLSSTTRPDIMMAVHQCARFCESPRLSHEKAVKRIVKYLIGTQHIGIHAQVDKGKGLEAYADSDFAGFWTKLDLSNIENIFSRTGYIIYYQLVPITWCSKLQTRIALSSTEAEYTALSKCLRDVIPAMNLIDEISKNLDANTSKPKIKCRLYEDNESCIKIAKAPVLTPRTKHIALEYHHFRKYVEDGSIALEPIRTNKQNADLLTKPVEDPQYTHLRKKLNGH